jgi:Mg-chelatase subunit ChlD
MTQPRAVTNLGKALTEAANVLQAYTNYNRVVVVLTDGDPSDDPKPGVDALRVYTSLSGPHSPLPSHPFNFYFL